jgi:hypothetical protein
VTFFALAGILLLIEALDTTPKPSTINSRLLAAAGLLLGLAFLMKQHGLFFGLFGTLYLLWVTGGEWLAASRVRSQQPGVNSLRERTQFVFTSPAALAGLERLIRSLGWFTLGWLLPCGLTCLVLWGAGVLPQFVFWTITYAGNYASAFSLVNGPGILRAARRVVVGPNLVFCLLPWIGMLVMWWEARLDEGSLKSKVQSLKSEVSSQEPASRSTLHAPRPPPPASPTPASSLWRSSSALSRPPA